MKSDPSHPCLSGGNKCGKRFMFSVGSFAALLKSVGVRINSLVPSYLCSFCSIDLSQPLPPAAPVLTSVKGDKKPCPAGIL